ncbi:MAG TPA: DEAD/DEAH box helicase family protein, partial [Candidatus Wallbacteria bacterium]|nr:DEAD/DEAH box helicase family protein [Candidatus Wallbacteria bacterium]
LSSVKKLTLADVEDVIEKFGAIEELGMLATFGDEEHEKKPWEKARPEKELTQGDFTRRVSIVRANMLHIEKSGISQRALNRIKRLAAFKNPEFYKAQAMRLSTYKKSRIIWTLDETREYLSIPRGCEPALVELLNGAEAEYSIIDKRNAGKGIKVEFAGELNDEQKLAADALAKADTGVLAAATAFGKTVIGANLIAVRKVNALVLVHTQALLTQWKKALERLLIIAETPPEQTQKRGRRKICHNIGQIGAGIDRRSGIVDVAVMQSLLIGEDGVKEFVKDYGLIIVDECHHVAAFSFEKILKQAAAKYIYGLTATPARQDGHHPIIFMQCGPVRYRVDAKAQAVRRPFDHYVVPRFTGFKKPLSQDEKEWSITQIYAALAEDEIRNRRIADDAVKSLAAGRSPIILTGRSAHVAALAAMLEPHCPNVITLIGSASQKEKREMAKRLDELSRNELLIIVATGKYVGEGFDCPRLDTMLLAMPIAWKGTVAQYAGRLHRQYDGKNEVIIYDYVDAHVPVLEKMYHKRVKGYSQIGYKAMPESYSSEKTNIIFDENSFQPVFAVDLAAARKQIIIVSPFMKTPRVKQMIMQLSCAALNGASITVITRPPEDFTGGVAEMVRALTRLLNAADIKVVFKSKMHQKYTIIDQKIVWYGSVNFLSYGFGEESVMRLESFEIAAELLDTA